MHRQTLGIVLFIAGALSAPAYAESLEAFSGVIAGLNECAGGGAPAGMYAFFGNQGFGIGSGGNGISDCGLSGGINDIFQPVGPVQSAYNLNYTGGYGGLGSTYSGSATATTNYGSVDASITGSLSGPDRANGVAESAAYGIAADDWIINGGTGTGYAALTFSINGAEGSMLVPESGAMAAIVNVQLGSGTPETILNAGVSSSGYAYDHNGADVAGCITTASSFSCPIASISTGLLPVTFGTDMAFNLGALITVEPGPGGTTDPDVILTGIQIYDASGTPLSDFTITSGSGAVYGPDGIESAPGDTPEPATFLLLGGALLAIGGRRRNSNSAN